MKRFFFLTFLICLAFGLTFTACGKKEAGKDGKPAAAEKSGKGKVVKIGINAPMTGDLKKVGEATKNACDMWVEDVNKAGGLTIGGEKYEVKLVVENNETKPETAKAANVKLIQSENVIAIVGPQSSAQAVPAGEIANKHKTVMISAWSTNPNTTKDRPYVFRACFLDPFQGPVVANFIEEEFKLTKAAVLFDLSNPYCKGLAENFKEAWEKKSGASVVAYESFNKDEKEFRTQLTKIKNSGAEILFTPQYYNEVHLIVDQARSVGFEGQIVGSDSWGDPQTIKLCGDKCYGLFFSSHYAAAGAKGATKEFIDRYQKQFNAEPSDVAALSWDAIRIIGKGLEGISKMDADMQKNRDALKDSIAKVTKFKGITGTMNFDETGDPVKCAVIVKINDKGQYEFYKQICP